MRNCLLTLLLFYLGAYPGGRLIAQVRNNFFHEEVTIGVGDWSSVQLLEGVHAGEDGYSEYPISQRLGPFSISFRHYFAQWIAFGLAAVYEHENGDWSRGGWSYYGPTTIGKYKRQVFNVAPELLITYSRSRRTNLTIYGYLGVGYSYLNSIEMYSAGYYLSQYSNGVNSLGPDMQKVNNKINTGVHVCPIGLSLGKKYRWFVEGGFGYKGILNTGMTLKF